MARVRTFIAVPLPDEIRTQLAGLQRQLGNTIPEVKWVENENLHVTMVFLGDVSAEEIPAICRAAQEAVVELSPFRVEVKGIGCFPNPRRPRILWAGMGLGASELQLAYEALTLYLEPLGFRREERSFTPHVTLGRLKGEHRGPGVAKELDLHAEFVAGETVVEEVHIFSSEPTRQGPHYQVLGRARLVG